VIQVAFFLVAEGYPVSDQELKIARVRLVDGGVVDLIDDAMALEVQRGSIPGAPNATRFAGGFISK
jgi:hypothetical protein